MTRVAVIGAGVVGACVAHYLVREGVEVLLVEQGRPGQATTGASFAWVNASAKVNHPKYFELNFAGMDEHMRLVGRLGSAGWWNASGHVRWDYRSEHDLVSHVEELKRRGYPAEVWASERVHDELEPEVDFGAPRRSAAVFPSEAWVDGPKMAEALAETAREEGAVTAFGSPVVMIAARAGAVSAIELVNGERYSVDAVVNAAGPAAAGVAALVGRVLPMRSAPGLAVRVAMREGLLGRVLHPPDVAIRPDGDRRGFLLARDLLPVGGTRGNASLAREVKRFAELAVPELREAPIVDVRVGHRALPEDGFPAIGKASKVNGYYEAVTHSGITLAPILGRTLTREIVTGEVDPLVAPFRASRLGSG